MLEVKEGGGGGVDVIWGALLRLGSLSACGQASIGSKPAASPVSWTDPSVETRWLVGRTPRCQARTLWKDVENGKQEGGLFGQTHTKAPQNDAW